MIVHSFFTQQQAIEAIKHYLTTNKHAFTGIQLSVIETYYTYLNQGGLSFPSLTKLYQRKYGLALPESSYLDNAYIQDDSKKKRLLWGTVNRPDWQNKHKDQLDLDILNKREIKTEEHALGKFRQNGVPRGNIIALLFFHFCFEKEQVFRNASLRQDLFNEFYIKTNYTLIDECAMMPLHPRKQLDSLFLKAIANSGTEGPIEYLNNTLADFYSQT